MSDKYLLDEHGEPVRCYDALEWAMAFEKVDRRVAFDDVGDVEISTVFLGICHQFGDGPAMLFETMTRRAGEWAEQWRYSTRVQALAGHDAVVRWVKGEGEEP